MTKQDSILYSSYLKISYPCHLAVFETYGGYSQQDNKTAENLKKYQQ